MFKKIKRFFKIADKEENGWIIVMILYTIAATIACIKGYSRAVTDCTQFVLIACLFYENAKLNNKEN